MFRFRIPNDMSRETLQRTSMSNGNCSFRAIFRPQNIFYAAGKQCSEQPDVFFSFSFIFGCELTVFSVNLDAEHWNLEFFGWTKNVVWVNPKNSRFQCEASRWTEYAWTGKQLKRICEPEKNVPCRTAKCPKGKVNIKQKMKKKNGNQLPQRQVLSQSTTKLFITQKETRYSFPIRSKAQNVGALEKILCAQPNTSFKSSWQL